MSTAQCVSCQNTPKINTPFVASPRLSCAIVIFELYIFQTKIQQKHALGRLIRSINYASSPGVDDVAGWE